MTDEELDRIERDYDDVGVVDDLITEVYRLRKQAAAQSAILSAIKSQWAEAGWTKEPPTVPGWYWYRPQPGNPAWLVELWQNAKGLMYAEADREFTPVCSMHGEWAGPLEPPG